MMNRFRDWLCRRFYLVPLEEYVRVCNFYQQRRRELMDGRAAAEEKLVAAADAIHAKNLTIAELEERRSGYVQTTMAFARAIEDVKAENGRLKRLASGNRPARDPNTGRYAKRA